MTSETILITGASSGLGAALARHYARSGVTLALTGRNQERLAKAAECVLRGATCRIVAMDVREYDRLADWIRSIDKESAIDLTILNAGLAATRVNASDGELGGEIIAQIETNLAGTLMAGQVLGEMMFKRRQGHVAFVSSLNGLFPVVEAPTYSATKAGILAYAEAIRDWLEPAGVHVTTISPGFVRTAIADRYHGQRPLEFSAAKAAIKIARGLERRQRKISFPWPLLVGVQLGRVVPGFLRRRILAAYTAQLQRLDARDITRSDQ